MSVGVVDVTVLLALRDIPLESASSDPTIAIHES